MARQHRRLTADRLQFGRRVLAWTEAEERGPRHPLAMVRTETIRSEPIWRSTRGGVCLSTYEEGRSHLRREMRDAQLKTAITECKPGIYGAWKAWLALNRVGVPMASHPKRFSSDIYMFHHLPKREKTYD